MSTLITFMTAAGEGYQHAIASPGADPESMRLFPIWVSEAAYMNADELAILTVDSSDVSVNHSASMPDPELASGRATSTHRTDPVDGAPTL